MEIILGILGGGLCSWLISHIYYKRSAAKERAHLEKEILVGKLRDYQRALARMGDGYLRAAASAEADLSRFVETNAEEIQNFLGHHQGFVKETLKEHRDELDFTSIERLDTTMYSLWWKYW